MKILFFTSKPIYPSVDGGCFASEKFLSSLLNTQIDLRYATLSTNKHPFDLKDFPHKLLHQIQPQNFFINTDVSPISAVRAFFKSGSYNASRFYSKEIERDLISFISKEKFDGIVFDSLYTLPYLDGVRAAFSGKIVARTHNVEHQLWKQYASEASGIKKWYLNQLARDLKEFEISYLSKVDSILSISKDDSAEFIRIGIKTKIVDIPVAIKVAESPANNSDNQIYHLGMMNWEPNRQAVRDLIEWIPELRAQHPHLELHIAGSGSKEFVETDTSEGVYVHGFVDSAEEFARTHGILVSPMRAASGVRIKFLEAMAQGVPIITTSVGALGIDHASTNCLSIANSKEDFFRAISEMSSNPTKREEIGRNALNYIDKNHNIDAISQKIVEVFEGNT